RLDPLLLHRPQSDRGGHPRGGVGPHGVGADAQGRQGGVGGRSAAGPQRLQQRGLLQPQRVMDTMTGVWSWHKPEDELVDRSNSPWDREPRRASHADKRKALQREVLRAEIQEALSGRPTKERIRQLAERLLALAA